MAFDQAYYLPDNLLAKVGSNEHGALARSPSGVSSITASSNSRPSFRRTTAIHGRTLKFLLRNLMKDKLPQTMLDRSKQGLDIPVHDWLRGHLKPLLLDTLNRKT